MKISQLECGAINRAFDGCLQYFQEVNISSIPIFDIQTKMCIKSSPNLHKKSANWALDIVSFYALMLMLLLTKLIQNFNLESAVPA